MPKKKQFVKITATCDKSEHFAYAICEEDVSDEMKHRLLRSIVDFSDVNETEFNVKLEVEPTKELPEQGTDIHIIPLHPRKPQESEIDVIPLE